MSLAHGKDSDLLFRVQLGGDGAIPVFAFWDGYGHTWLDNELGDAFELVSIQAEAGKDEWLHRLAASTNNEWTPRQLKRLLKLPVMFRVLCGLHPGEELTAVATVGAQNIGYAELPERWNPYPKKIISVNNVSRKDARAERATYVNVHSSRA